MSGFCRSREAPGNRAPKRIAHAAILPRGSDRVREIVLSVCTRMKSVRRPYLTLSKTHRIAFVFNKPNGPNAFSRGYVGPKTDARLHASSDSEWRGEQKCCATGASGHALSAQFWTPVWTPTLALAASGLCNSLRYLVGPARFELATSCTPSKKSNPRRIQEPPANS